MCQSAVISQHIGRIGRRSFDRRMRLAMREQILDLEELDHDIYEFRVKAPKNKKLQEVMSNLGKIDYSKLPF